MHFFQNYSCKKTKVTYINRRKLNFSPNKTLGYALSPFTTNGT